MGRWTHRTFDGLVSVSPYDGFSKDSYSPGTLGKDVVGVSAVIGWTHTFNPTATLEIRPSYAYAGTDRISPDVGVDWTTRAGIQGFGPGISDVFPIYPTFRYAGFTGLMTSLAGLNNVHSRDIVGNLTLVRGRHLVKVGSSFSSYQEGILPHGAGYGDFSFDGNWTSNPAGTGASGAAFGDYLLGSPISGGRYVPPGKFYMQLRNLSTYVQEDWKVTPNFTLNLGLRYEVNFPTTEKYNQLASWTPHGREGRGAIIVPDAESISERYWPLHSSLRLSLPTYRPLMVLANEVGLPARSLRPTNYKVFAPRVGIAWRMAKDLTVSTGYGIFFNQLDGNRETEYLSPPFLIRENGIPNDQD